MTIGDAVASFLDNRDEATRNTGLVSIHDIKKDYGAGANTWDTGDGVGKTLQAYLDGS